jgi:hypothetical protein
MLEPIKVPRITEADIDAVVCACGGVRIQLDNKQNEYPHADYHIGNTLLELKILEEDPLLKEEKQLKIADYYKDTEGDTIVIEEYNESKGRDRKFLHIFETPVKTAFKKASRQLQSSRSKMGDAGINGLLLINDGLQSLYHDELKTLAQKCIINDTKSIDVVIVAGIYYYSDGFESYFIAPIDAFYAQIKRGSSDLEKLLRKEWNNFVTKYMKCAIMDVSVAREKDCVDDYVFFVNERRYVKVAPGMGPSQIYKSGRPRRNTDVRSGGYVCTVIPDFNEDAYGKFSQFIGVGNINLKDNYPSYKRWLREKTKIMDGALKLNVSFDVSDCLSKDNVTSYESVCSLASNMANEKLNDIAERAIEVRGHPIARRFVLVEYEEIGKDAENDVSTISLIEDEVYVRKFVVRKSLDYNRSLALGAAYCLALNIDLLYYKVDSSNAWR